MQVRILNLDGALLPQSELRSRYSPDVFDVESWGPRIRLACDFMRFGYFEQDLQQRLGNGHTQSPAITFYGSGDFHHVSLALVRRLPGPFNLLVLDKHPDWMRRVPFLHCGTWLYHAARLPQVRRIFHVGGDVDFDNFYRVLAPWKMLERGKIVVLPAVRKYSAGRWATLPNTPLRDPPQAPVRPAMLRDWLIPYRDELAQVPLYISLDKDVMVPADAVVNWDSGHLSMGEVQDVLTAFVQAARGELAGMDVVGDWSPVDVAGWFRWMFHMTMHPTLEVKAPAANDVNQRGNLAVMETVLNAMQPARRAG